MLAAERVLGAIAPPADPTIGKLLDMGIPVVAFDREVADSRADAVTAGVRATEFLLERGHANIGFISGRLEIQTGVDPKAGYERAMRVMDWDPTRPQECSGSTRRTWPRFTC